MKIKKGGPLVTALVIILLYTAYIIIPSALFEVKYIWYCMSWGFLFSMLTYGAYEINRTVRTKLEFSHLFGSGFVGFCLSALAYIAFASIKQKDMVDLARCASLFAVYFTIIYIVEKIHTTRKENKAETEKREIIIERNKPIVGWTYVRLKEENTLNYNDVCLEQTTTQSDYKKIVTLSVKDAYIVIKITDNEVFMKSIFYSRLDREPEREPIHNFPFKYKCVYNAVDLSLLEKMNDIKESLEERKEEAEHAYRYIKTLEKY